MRMMIAALLVSAGCGGGSSRERDACKKIASLCDVDVSAADVGECVDDFAKMRRTRGDDTADRFRDCATGATSCVEVLGCGAGAISMLGDDFARGVDRMTRDRPHADDRAEDDVKPLPKECKRANDVCAADEPFARDECRDLVGNLRADAPHLRELTTCYAAAVNCFEFQRCTSDLRFKLM